MRVVEKSEICFWFSALPCEYGRAVGMLKSRDVGEISKGRWKRWEACLSAFHRFPRARHFHSSLPSCGYQRLLSPSTLDQQRLLGLLHPLGCLRIAHPRGLNLQPLGCNVGL